MAMTVLVLELQDGKKIRMSLLSSLTSVRNLGRLKNKNVPIVIFNKCAKFSQLNSMIAGD